jgi:3'-phosphoadenosine 5'-phosphosulfate sulfotransferase (PAPS reductase)/FAD synthetase
LSNPYLLDRPAVVSFSGGRTSGYMLWHIIQAFGGTLPDDVKVIFCNTGKERPETLDFVERCSQWWGVAVTWLEYRHAPDGERKHTFTQVDYTTASRNGEPFEQIILARQCLPNVRARFCTSELKMRTNMRYLKSIGWTDWDNAIGLRADEPHRVARIRGRQEVKCETPVVPLADAGATLIDVNTFWGRQSFDLELRQDEGNCDLCFLKGPNKVRRLVAERPESADWWARMETLIPSPRYGTLRFRNDRESYAAMKSKALLPGLFDTDPGEDDELSIACHCTD